MVLNFILPISQPHYSFQTLHSLITNVNIMCNITFRPININIRVISCGVVSCITIMMLVSFFIEILVSRWIFDPVENPPCCFQKAMLPPAFPIEMFSTRGADSASGSEGACFYFVFGNVFWILHLHTSEWPVYILHLQLYVKYTCFVQYISVTNLQWGCKSYFMLYFVQWHNSRRRQFFQTKQIFPNGLFKWIVQQSKPCTLFC